MEKLIYIGIILLFISIILIFIGSITQKSSIKSAGIIFIGPFPIGWASDKKMFYILITIVIILMILFIIFKKYLFS